jgi:hypothetical protein
MLMRQENCVADRDVRNRISFELVTTGVANVGARKCEEWVRSQFVTNEISQITGVRPFV